MIELLLLAVALSCDCAAISVANGARCAKIAPRRALLFACIYGAAQAVMPLLGYLLGVGFVRFIERFDHFVAFGILAFLGAKMVREGLAGAGEGGECTLDISAKELALGAIATSIDALAVGVTFAFGEVNVWLNAAVIGAVCVAMSFGATYVGRLFGERYKARALVAGGVILIGIGTKILLSHLFF